MGTLKDMLREAREARERQREAEEAEKQNQDDVINAVDDEKEPA